jgi:hypothetical protein
MRVCAIVFLAVLTLTACTQAAPFAASKAQTQIDDFKLGHVGIVTAHMERGVYSDEIQEEDLKSSLRSAITSRLSEYQGQSGFNIGVNVEAYALVNAAVPSVSSPKSILIMSVSFWDDSSDQKRIVAPVTVIAVDGLYGTSIIRTKPLKTKEQRVAALSAKAAFEIERYFENNTEVFAAILRERYPAVGVLASNRAQPAANVN